MNRAGENEQEYPGYFEQRRISPVIVNAAVLLGILAIYLSVGSLATILVSGIDLSRLADSASPEFIITDENLQPIRLVQFLAQIVILAVPVFFFVSLHTGQGQLLSEKNLSYLGLTKKASALEYIYPVLAVLLSHPLLSYAADLQLVVLDALFGVGDTLTEQRKIMEEFVGKLTMIRSPFEFIAVVGLVAVTPAICEELLFRGYIQKNFSRALSPALTVLLTGTIFGFYHLNATETLPLCMLGIYISYLRYQSDALTVSMSVHFANNFFSVIGMFTAAHAEQLGLSPEIADSLNSGTPDITSASAIVSALMSLVLVALATWFYKREAENRRAFQV